jgi:Mg/Co/Ni transporter MgtE
LRYDATTAGGLMTSQPLIVTPDTRVAEVLARIGNADLPVPSAVQAYVCEPPLTTPTGRYLGSVGFQRLLRRPPATEVGECVQSSVFVRPDLPERELAVRLAGQSVLVLGWIALNTVGLVKHWAWLSPPRPPTPRR